MRRRAASIDASTPGTRLPMPPSRDEVSRLAETLNEMLARLEAAFEHERRFVDDASHELRTPLALLRTELELALRQPRSREELERALRSAAEEAERLSRLAEDLLLFARFDQGQLPIRRERGSTRASCSTTSPGGSSAGAARPGGRSASSPATALLVDADPARLEQALGNLVENALAYGAGAVVALGSSRANGQVELHVTDEGPGFPPDFLPRAFDRFSRADEARRPRRHRARARDRRPDRPRARRRGRASRTAPGGGADAWISLAAA